MSLNAVKITRWAEIKADYFLGATPKELSAKYGVPAKTIRDKACKGSWAKQKSTINDNLQQCAQERIENLTDLALSRLEEVLTDDEVSTKDVLMAVDRVLDISGLKNSKQEIEVRDVPIIIDDIAERLEERGL